MSVTYRIDLDEHIVYLTVSGETSFDDWRDAMLAAFSDPSFRPGSGFLIDRRAAPAPATDYIRRVVAFLHQHSKELAGGRRAVVVGSTADYGMGRMAETLGEGLRSPLRVFTDIERARGWLRGSPD